MRSSRCQEASASAERRRREGPVTFGEGPDPRRGLGNLAEVYGAEVSEQTVSTVTDSVMEGTAEW